MPKTDYAFDSYILNMASDPSSVIPQELKDLFSWNPPQLNPLPGQKMSTKTRPSGFFYKHFSKELKLLRVERLPSLVHDIAAIVDKTVIESFKGGVQFSPSDELYSAKAIRRAVNNLDKFLEDEKAVASFYDKTTATFCVPVASILALRIPGMLRWTQSANVSGYAIADGFLKFAGPKTLADMDAQLKEAMNKETLKLFRRLAGRHSPLVTYKIKNLAAGGPEVMLAIPNLSNSLRFDWTSCNIPDCASTTKHGKERRKVGAVIVGHDATSTPWTFNSRSNNSMFPSDPKDHEEAVQSQHLTLPQPLQIARASASAQLLGSVPPPALSTVSPNAQGSSEDVGTSKAVKRKRGDDSGSRSRASSSLSTRGMTPQANPPLAPEASCVTEILSPTTLHDPGPRRSHRLASTTTPLPPTTRRTKKQKPADLINVCSFICSLPIVAHDKTLKVAQSTSLMPPPPLPVGVQVEAAFPRETGKGKGKEVVKGKVEDVGDDEDGNDERNDQAIGDPSYKDDHDLSAECIVQQACQHSILPEIHSAD
jgi:hypothetical protein